MAEEEAAPSRPRGWAVAEAAREDLEVMGVAELEERIAALEAEIGRARTQLDRKRTGRAAADAFFKRG
jgi:uncharacterized small protein (DUF1192 family)